MVLKTWWCTWDLMSFL